MFFRVMGTYVIKSFCSVIFALCKADLIVLFGIFIHMFIRNKRFLPSFSLVRFFINFNIYKKAINVFL